MKRQIVTAVLILLFLLGGCAGSQQPGSSGLASDEHVKIDFSSHENEFVTQDILNTLESNLKALANKDKEEFIKGFISGHESANMFWVTDEKEFTFLDIISTQKSGDQINIAIKYNATLNGNSEENTLTYTFLQQEDGDWGIVMID